MDGLGQGPQGGGLTVLILMFTGARLLVAAVRCTEWATGGKVSARRFGSQRQLVMVEPSPTAGNAPHPTPTPHPYSGVLEPWNPGLSHAGPPAPCVDLWIQRFSSRADIWLAGVTQPPEPVLCLCPLPKYKKAE